MRPWAIGAAVVLGLASAAPDAAAAQNGLIAFQRDGAIYTASSDGGSIEQQTVPPQTATGTFDSSPSWSPDGRRLAFVRGCSIELGCPTAEGAYATTGFGQASVASTIAAGAQRLDWSPDQQSFLVVRDGQAFFTTRIPAPGCPGGYLNMHFDGGASDAAWSPDGTRVALVQGSGLIVIDTIAMRQSNNPFDQCSGPDVTSETTPLCPSYNQNGQCPNQAYQSFTAVAWAPDGQRLVAAAPDGLRVFNADGSGVRVIDSGAGDDHPTWSPDGTEIAFQKQNGAYTDLWVVGADGSDPHLLIPDASEPSWQAREPFRQCALHPPHLAHMPLAGDDNQFVSSYEFSEEYQYELGLVTLINRLVADANANHSHFQQDAARVAVLKQILATLRRLKGAHQAEAPPAQLSDSERQLVRSAACGLVDDAVSSLKSYVDDSNVKQKEQAKELIGKVDTLGKILTGDIKRDSGKATEVLKENVIDLIAQFAGKDAKKYLKGADELHGKGSELFSVLNGSLKQDQLDAALEKNIKALAGKIAGSNGSELATQLITLRKMMSGTATEEEQYAALKTAFVDLATRLLGKGIMSTPQVRAAMLGFQIGTALGNSIAANLKLIQKRALVETCASALARAQGNNIGELDYGLDTNATITKQDKYGVAFEDGQCEIKKDGFREGVKGGVVEVRLPKYYLWFYKSVDYYTLYYDPAFAGPS